MTETLTTPQVLTLQEAAEYLRVSEDTLSQLAAQQKLPGRQIGDEWRFLKSALDDWLRGPSGKELLLHQVGAFADDPSLPQILDEVYKRRGRPQAENDD